MCYRWTVKNRLICYEKWQDPELIEIGIVFECGYLPVKLVNKLFCGHQHPKRTIKPGLVESAPTGCQNAT